MREVVADAGDKDEQQAQRSNGSPRSRERRNERHSDCEFSQRQEQSESVSQSGRHTKVAQGLPRPSEIRQLGQAAGNESQPLL